jgi:2C-methyl-D-erythritol 2,4-cyclodiphosphate synthase
MVTITAHEIANAAASVRRREKTLRSKNPQPITGIAQMAAIAAKTINIKMTIRSNVA